MAENAHLRPSTFYDALYSQMDGGYVAISVLDQRRVGLPHAWTDTIEAVELGGAGIGERLAKVVADVDAGGEARNVYFTPAPRRTPKRGHVGNTAALTCLWAEFDSPSSSPTKDPSAAFSDQGEVVSLFYEQGLPMPGVIVASGNGWHCYWPLEEPIPWDDAGAELLARWGTFVIERAARKNKWVDRVFDAARVLRCPGTHNHKHDPPAEVTVTSYDGSVVSVSELDDILPPLDEASRNLWSTTHDISGLGVAAITEWIDAASSYETNTEGRRALEGTVTAIREVGPGGRHDLVFTSLAKVIQNTKGHRSQLNVTDALSAIHGVFVKVKPDADESEFRNMVRYLVGQRIREDEQKASSTVDVAGLPLSEVEAGSLHVDWRKLTKRDEAESNFLVPGVIAKGVINTLQSQAGVGKSFVAIAIGLNLSTGNEVLGLPHPTGEPIKVAYFDWEMGPDDLTDRVYCLGFDPDADDLSSLRYVLYPPFTLDDEAGADELIEYLISEKIEVAIFDTMSRAISRSESDDVGWREAMRLAWTPMKRMGITVIRLDHLGKQKKLGGRGSSTKRDEADLIWNLTKDEKADGTVLNLKINKARMLVPAQKMSVAWRVGEHGLVTFTADQADPIFNAPPAEIADIIAEMDALDLPIETGRPAARKALKYIGSDRILMAAVKARKLREPIPRSSFSDEEKSSAQEGSRSPRAGVTESPGSSTTESNSAARGKTRAATRSEEASLRGAQGDSLVVARTRSLDSGPPFLCPACGETELFISPFEPFDLICGNTKCDAPPMRQQDYPYRGEADEPNPAPTSAVGELPPPPRRSRRAREQE